MLKTKYKFPLNLFIVFEHTPSIVYTSEVLTTNHYVCFITSQWYFGLNTFIKNDCLINSNFLIEMSSIDTLKYNNILPEIEILKKNRLLSYNMYYIYFNKIRLTFMYTYSHNTFNKLQSLDNLYPNSNWLERETSEMFNIIYFNKQDSRSLLLDYSSNDYPMLKDFPTEGLTELYYDFFDQHLHYVSIEHIEL
jgi:NADH:ubiquinone oxidoreductase subunit C